MAHLIALPIRDDQLIKEGMCNPWKLIAPAIMLTFRVHTHKVKLENLPKKICVVYWGKEFQGFLAVDVLSIEEAQRMWETALASTSMVATPPA